MNIYESGGAKNTTGDVSVRKEGARVCAVPRTYNSDPRLKRLDNMILVESSVHFWTESLRSVEILEQVDYQSVGRFPSSFPGWTIVMDGVPVLSSDLLHK